MKYRVKITKIQSWVENNYNTNAYNIVGDSKGDVFIELYDQHEAELIENINKEKEKLIELKKQWYSQYQ